jgi:hypothetical protein
VLVLLSFVLLFAQEARAQSDAPLPYSDEPTRAKETARDFEHAERKRELATGDDPSLGLGAELVGGLFLLASPRGAMANPTFGGGARVTWDFGRLFAEPWVHEGFFLDGTWLWTGYSDGTPAAQASSSMHNLTLSPAFELTFGPESAYGVYAQVGGGISLESVSLQTGTTAANQGINPLLQYGVGFRGRPRLSDESNLRLTFRVELTRLRRGYLDDTLLLGSLGLAL